MEKKKKQTAETRIKAEMRRTLKEVKDTFSSTASLIISALTLVAGLAWNDVAKAYFSRLKEKLSGWGEAVGLFLYAFVVTVIAVIIIHRLRKIQKAVGGKSIKEASKKVK